MLLIWYLLIVELFVIMFIIFENHQWLVFWLLVWSCIHNFTFNFSLNFFFTINFNNNLISFNWCLSCSSFIWLNFFFLHFFHFYVLSFLTWFIMNMISILIEFLIKKLMLGWNYIETTSELLDRHWNHKAHQAHRDCVVLEMPWINAFIHNWFIESEL